MKFHQIEIEGFQSYRERETIDFTGVDLAVVTGENGVGKSTMITDAVAMCFYGKTRTATLEEVISTESLYAQVVITYELGGILYKMQRTFPRVGTQEAQIFVADEAEESGWRALTQRGARENTAFITEQLGMDYETATTTWLALQGDYGKFSTAKPAERYGTLSGIFGLGAYAPLQAKASQHLNKAESGVRTAEARIDEIEKTLAAKPDLTLGEFGGLSDEDLDTEAASEQALADELGTQIAELTVGDPGRARDELAQSLTRVKGHRQSSLQAAQTRLSDLDAQLSRATQAQTKGENDQSRIAAALWEMDTLLAKKETLGTEVEALGSAVQSFDQAAAAQAATADALTVEYNSLTERKKVAGEKLAGLRKATPGHSAECFTCGQHLSDEDTARLVAEQEAEIAAVDARQAEIVTAGQAARAAATEAQQQASAGRDKGRALQRELDTLSGNIGSMKALIETKPDVDAAVAAATDEVATLTTAVGEAKAAVSVQEVPSEEEVTLARQLQEAEASARTAAAEVNARRQALRDTQTRHSSRVRALGQEKFRREDLRAREAELESRLDAIRDERAEAAKNKRVYGVLTKAFSPAGIPAMILTGVVEEIAQEVNVALATLSNGQLSVDIRASKESKSGGIQQKIVIYVDAPDGTRAYETLSGGQRFRVDLAIRTGLNKVISRRTGTPIQTFVIDEGWGTLDEAGVLSAVDTMERLSKELTVLTVSHIDEVKNAFPTVFEVTMDAGTSTVNRLSR